MEPLPDAEITVNNQLLLRHEKAALWLALDQMTVYYLDDLNEVSKLNWQSDQIAVGKESLLRKIKSDRENESPEFCLGTEDLNLVISALGAYGFNESLQKGARHRLIAIRKQFEELKSNRS